MSLLSAQRRNSYLTFDEVEYFEERKKKGIKSFEKEVYLKVPVKIFSRACRNTKEQNGMKLRQKMLSDLNKMVYTTVTIPLFAPVFQCSVNINNFVDYKIRGVYNDY